MDRIPNAKRGLLLATARQEYGEEVGLSTLNRGKKGPWRDSNPLPLTSDVSAPSNELQGAAPSRWRLECSETGSACQWGMGRYAAPAP